MSKAILQLHSNCLLVKGYSRAVICDLQRDAIHFIPNSLAGLLSGRNLRMAQLEKHLDEEGKVVLKEYADFLLETGLAFYCTEEDLPFFPELVTDWDYPALISNCILDGIAELTYFNTSFLKQLDVLCCRYLQLRFFCPVSLQYLEEITALISVSEIKAVELILCDTQEKDFCHHILKLVEQCGKIKAIVIHSAREKGVLKESFYDFGAVIKTKEQITSHLYCGIVDLNYFQANIAHFTESLHHNTCLNRKISIDAAGNIKNCPSMGESFGNIKDTSLIEALEKPGFRKYWNVTKDQINTCRDCEFRHICTDCRAYIENPEDACSKPLKCGYDPYTRTWEAWSTHPAKQKAIKYYGLRELKVW